IGAAIRTWAAAYLRSGVVRDSKLHSDVLVVDGPYRHVRNPLYLGIMVQWVGIGFLVSPLGFVVLIAGTFFRLLRLIGLEEKLLGESQGEHFHDFCRRVPRLWPSLRPRLAAGELAPQWGQACVGELWTWVLFLGMAALSITQRVGIAWRLMLAG